jgi:hypothetical protein
MRNELGREPTPEEMSELTAAMSSVYRQDFEAEVAAMRAEFDAQQQALATGTPVTPAATVDIDPAARFAQLFDQRFGAELDYIEGQAEQQQIMRSVFESLTTMQSLIGP